MGRGREGNWRNFYGGLGKEKAQDMFQVGDSNSLQLENPLPRPPPPAPAHRNGTEHMNFPPSWFKRASFTHHPRPAPSR